MSSSSSTQGPPGKYWENMNDNHSKDPSNDNASWVSQFLPSWVSGENQAAKNSDEEMAPPTGEKPSQSLKRTSTISTAYESEVFSCGSGDEDADADKNNKEQMSNVNLNEEEEGWEVELSGASSLMEKYTRRPHFVKRCSIATLVLLFVVILVSVLCATLTDKNDVPATPSGSTGNETPDTPPSSDDDSDITDSSSSFDLNKPAAPFSTLNPVEELGMFGVVHSRIPPRLLQPQQQRALQVTTHKNNKAMPTNAWYENLLHGANEDAPTNLHKAYTVPYIVDAVGPIAGVRIAPTHLDAQATMVNLQTVQPHGLTLGVSGNNDNDKSYSIASFNPLGVTLQWNAFPMTSSIIRGMPYSTMHYPKTALSTNSGNMLPTIASEVALQSPPTRDGDQVMECSTIPTRVEREMSITFQSDYTWMVFFSEPVMVQCMDSGNMVLWQVTSLVADDDNTMNNNSQDQLTIRAALLTSCTNNLNGIYCNDGNTIQEATAEYQDLLRNRAHLYPGPNADVRYGVDMTTGKATVRLDWNVQDMTKSNAVNAEEELFMYALPHHLTRMQGSEWMPWNGRFCVTSLIGDTCAVSGAVWDLEEDLPIASFRSPRPPRVEALPAIVSALERDILYTIPENFQRGAGDTYFSGKVLARVGRVLLILEELQDLCNGKAVGYDLTNEEKLAYMNACRDLTLPSDEKVVSTMNMFRSSVEVWVNGTAEARFAYDSGWGGVINCGCLWDEGTQGCSNSLPDCPATADQGLNFGNGYYNDHHFHYGYHVYAAAALTHFDRDWGRRHFEDVLLLIRDYTNPSDDDVFFPRFRQKDWYQGSSWASGITLPTFGNVMNQESTSEAIAGYEAVALFGKEMMLAWNEVKDASKVTTSRDIRDVGLVTAATEIRSTNYYWHIERKDDSRKIFPDGYKHQVVGILWATMAQFTTWFGNAPYLIYGIQLLPLTPIAENRDANQGWLREMYQPLADSCAVDAGCTLHGWSVLQLAILASIGNVDMAMEQAKDIPDLAFDSPGGNGHSMTNTLHYFATRPQVDEPADIVASNVTAVAPPQQSTIDCGIPQTCTSEALGTIAAGYTCRERIAWLMDHQGMNEEGACAQVAMAEFPDQCGACIAAQDNIAVAAARMGANGGVRV